MSVVVNGAPSFWFITPTFPVFLLRNRYIMVTTTVNAVSRRKRPVVKPRIAAESPKSKNRCRGRRENGTMMHCDGKQRKTMETIVYCVFVYLRTIETKESEMVGKFWRENFLTSIFHPIS